MEPQSYATVWNTWHAAFLRDGMDDKQARMMASKVTAEACLNLAKEQLGIPVTRTIRMAKSDGWGLVIMGGLSILMAIFSADAFSAAAGGFLCFCGWLELEGRKRYVESLPKAREYLMGSQLGLLFGIWSYCAWHIFGGSAAVSSEDLALLKQMGGDSSGATGLITGITQILYITMAAVTFLYQGGLALYYWRKTKA